MRLASVGSVAILLAAALPSSPALAVEETEIASSFDEDNPFDLFLTLDYDLEARRAAVKREFEGSLMTPPRDGVIPVVKDLVYKNTRHTIIPRVQIGIFHDVELRLELPVVLSDTREFRFDQRADPCIFPGGAQQPTCINRDNSTTILDGILPATGYDADDPAAGFAGTDDLIFRGVNRAGLDQVYLGLHWAPMNQKRDDTKPTWVIGADVRLSIGKLMKFDRLNPDRENGVSQGVHEIRLMTAISKRTSWAEPFVVFWWMAPLALRGDNPDDPDSSQFWDLGYGQETQFPQQQAGTAFGFEAIPWERRESQQKISIEFRGRVQAHFEGRGYSEIWEILAFAGDQSRAPDAVLSIDRDPTSTTDVPFTYPGITDIENYLTFGGRLGINGQVGEHARFGAFFDISTDQRHIVTFTDAGEELPGCTGAPAAGCEIPNDDVVTPGTAEVNPWHNRLIDLVGRRYIVDDTTRFTFLAHFKMLF